MKTNTRQAPSRRAHVGQHHAAPMGLGILFGVRYPGFLPLRGIHPGLFSRRAYGALTFVGSGTFASGK